jgi:hypothetical protein
MSRLRLRRPGGLRLGTMRAAMHRASRRQGPTTAGGCWRPQPRAHSCRQLCSGAAGRRACLRSALDPTLAADRQHRRLLSSRAPPRVEAAARGCFAGRAGVGLGGRRGAPRLEALSRQAVRGRRFFQRQGPRLCGGAAPKSYRGAAHVEGCAGRSLQRGRRASAKGAPRMGAPRLLPAGRCKGGASPTQLRGAAEGELWSPGRWAALFRLCATRC